MTPLIPALINLLVSGIRKKGGGGGGGGGGYGGGRPQMSDAEKSDRYWNEQLLTGRIDKDAAKELESTEKIPSVRPWSDFKR
jgi:hypothetical protein